MSKKTPQNPSKSATKRVKNPMPAPTECRYCSASVEIKHHDDIYGRAYGRWPWVYACSFCDSYVGMHPFTAIPLGTMADKRLRELRKACKTPFNRIHVNGLLTRSEAYARLSEKLGIEKSECHFGYFDRDMCIKASTASNELYVELFNGDKS